MRLRLYRRMAELDSLEAIDDFAQELADRFGPVPEPAVNLLYLLRLKRLATRTSVDSITTDEVLGRIVMRVRDRVVLLEWRPSREVERTVTVGRNSVTVPLQDGWMSILEKALREMSHLGG